MGIHDNATRAAESRLMNTIATDSSLGREANIQKARFGVKIARDQEIGAAERSQARDDRFRSTPTAQMSSSSGGGAGGALVVALAGVIWAVSAVIQFVMFVCTWLLAHVWNIVGAGLIIGGVYGLYLLTAHYYWKYR